jgi:hypothetical protein
VVEVVSQEHVGRRSLLGSGFQRGVRLQQSHHGKPTAVGNAEQAGPAVVVGDVLDQPIDRVEGVGAFIDGSGAGAIARRTLQPSADVLKDENETIGNHLPVVAQRSRETLGVVIDAVRRARDKKGERRGEALGHADFGMQANTVAHGDHHLRPGERLTEIRRGLARAGLRDNRHAECGTEHD